jgi:hypothetical protein
MDAISPASHRIEDLLLAVEGGAELRNAADAVRQVADHHQRFRDGMSSRRVGDLVVRELEDRLREQRAGGRRMAGPDELP